MFHSRRFQGSFKGRLKDVSREILGCFKEAYLMAQVSLEGDARKFQGYLKNVSKVFL